ncbi:hypothetical protein [Streptomyces sp. VRA16 Mangrove soil]|uniref:hypothetical protein n=1 Tax=Streptomyces sp. VRA16 Mangrove soil TaxID=2817434 RepID=UPI001A9CFE03|nr:hypothetical protein [Streptomyces sp. VRA16 Mangrove soil]MBO1333026.1 hypothetical protein [Streptomyces sp. VRA16 Mangrove soil]
MRTFLPAEFWWMFGELLAVSLVVVCVAVVVADALLLRLRRRRSVPRGGTPVAAPGPKEFQHAGSRG